MQESIGNKALGWCLRDKAGQSGNDVLRSECEVVEECQDVNESTNLAFLSHRICSMVRGAITRQHVKLGKHERIAK